MDNGDKSSIDVMHAIMTFLDLLLTSVLPPDSPSGPDEGARSMVPLQLRALVWDGAAFMSLDAVGQEAWGLTMRAAVLLDLDTVEFMEPSFERLADDSYTQMLLAAPAKEAKLLISSDEYPLAVALNDGKAWRCASFLLRKPVAEIFDKLEELDAEVLQEERGEWEAAVREYYSLRIAKEVAPAIEDFTPTRVLAISSLLKERWGNVEGEVCVDACCGSGAGSVALRDLGMIPLSFDNDLTLLSLGLRAGRLLPEETVCVDGTRASRFIMHSHFGIMLMAGEIGPHNSVIWKRIVEEVMEVTDKIVVTMGTEREARLVEGWAKEKKRKVEVLENKREAFYDNWVCDIRRM